MVRTGKAPSGDTDRAIGRIPSERSVVFIRLPEHEAGMAIYESDLPGVGKKFEIEIEDEQRLVIVTHNTGKREVLLKATEGADSEKLFELPDRLARTVGTILEGAYFQPVQSEQVETMLAEGTFLEWYNVDEKSEIAGQTLADARVRERTGVSVAAIERAGSVVPSPQADTVIEVGDTLVVIGSQEDLHEFDALVSNDAANPE
mgnify:CR=1 FL=1